jgi:AacA4 family aminoglycoside N(6')-acetyltransferase
MILVGFTVNCASNRSNVLSNEIELRLMTEQDIPLLHDWLQRPHVVEWWGSEDGTPSIVQTHEWYAPRVLASENVTPYIALFSGKPMAYAQSYVAMGSGDGWWTAETDPGVRGIDVFVADENILNKGIGTGVVSALVRRLFTEPAVTKIQADPNPLNTRAIRCYEKAGFERIGPVLTPDGLALYMVQSRP